MQRIPYKRPLILSIIIIIIFATTSLIGYRMFSRRMQWEFLKLELADEIEYAEQISEWLDGAIIDGVLPAGTILELERSLKRRNIIYWFIIRKDGKIVQASYGVGRELARPYQNELSIVGNEIDLKRVTIHVADIAIPIDNHHSLQIAFPRNTRLPVVPLRVRRSFLIMLLPGGVLIILLLVMSIFTYLNIYRMKGEIAEYKSKAYLGEISSDFAHELKNPLNTVKMNIQLIQENTDFQENTALMKKIDRIDRELNRLTNYLANYLRFARTPAMQISRFDLNETVLQVVRFFAPECVSAGITIMTDLWENPVYIKADEKQIKQMLLNLLLNAKEATKKGGHITVSTAKKSGEVQLSIRDTGSGISKESLQKIFMPFYTTKKGGTGIGMSVVKRILEDHGAKINVQSQKGKGTKFTIIFI
ncbi:MAG: sensor histidine kinase [Candidatus Zixiibacteriota bacterium]